MRLVSLTICRNSGWSIEAVLRSALRWVDHAFVFDHASDDNTPEVLAKLKAETGRVTVMRDPDPVWREARHRQLTIEAARKLGATHCAIVDDDEILTENLVPTIRVEIENLALGEVLQIPWVILWRSLDQFRDDGSVWSNSWVSMAFRDAPPLHWETRNGYDHHHRHPFGSTCKHVGELHRGGLMHYQHANWKRLVAKQTWYQCVELVRWPEFGVDQIKRRYGPTLDETGLRVSPVPAGWWGPERQMIQIDAEPWQTADIQRMVAKYGADYFRGIL